MNSNMSIIPSNYLYPISGKKVRRQKCFACKLATRVLVKGGTETNTIDRQTDRQPTRKWKPESAFWLSAFCTYLCPVRILGILRNLLFTILPCGFLEGRETDLVRPSSYWDSPVKYRRCPGEDHTLWRLYLDFTFPREKYLDSVCFKSNTDTDEQIPPQHPL